LERKIIIIIKASISRSATPGFEGVESKPAATSLGTLSVLRVLLLSSTEREVCVRDPVSSQVHDHIK
jgi:hypothetical protein